MKIALVYSVKAPSRGTSKSAGLDFFVPEFSAEFVKSFLQKNSSYYQCSLNMTDKSIRIKPHRKVMIPLGLKVEVPEGYAFIAFNKTGVSWDNTIFNLSAVVDEDYQGMLFLTVVNYSEDVSIILENQKVIQLVLVPVKYESVEIVPESQIHTSISERSTGAFGSTGKF